MTRRPTRLLVLVLLLASLPAWAVTEEGAMEGSDEEGGGLGLSAMVTLDSAVGIGSFYRSDTALFAPALTFRASWLLPGTENVRLNGRFDLELLGLSDLDAYTDRDPNEQVRAADVMLTLSHGKLFEDDALTGLVADGSLRFYLPTSNASSVATMLVGIGPRLGLTRKFGFVTLYGGSRYIYRFLRYDNTVFEYADDDSGAVQGCASNAGPAVGKLGAERGDQLFPNNAPNGACGGPQNYDQRFIHDMSVEFRFTKRLALTATLFIINSWGIERPIDEYTSEVSRRTGNETQRDLTWGIVDLTYDVSDHLSLSFGTSSLQNAKSFDGERLRFPWWDLEGPQANSTSLYVDITGAI